jgi:hypothetical protein
MRNRQVPGHGLTAARRTEDELHPHTIHVGILKERRSRACLEDVQVLAVEVIRVQMTELRRKDRRQPGMMVFGQPHREDIEPPIAGEHRIERREIAQRFFHDLCACLYENAMHRGRDSVQFLRAASGYK